MLELEEKIIKMLREFWNPQNYIKECTIFYHGQIPMGAIYLENGPVYFTNRYKNLEITKPGIYLLDEIINEKSIKFNVKVTPESKIFILDRFTINKLYKDKVTA